MSIIRLSCENAVLYAPTDDGKFVAAPYDEARLAGRIGEFARAGEAGEDVAALDRHLDAKLAAAARDLKTGGGPAVVMVNGFKFNPRAAVWPNPEKSDNPHAVIFHFRQGDETAEGYAHATGWPAALGFEEADHGHRGLVVAFGWFSSPGFLESLVGAKKNFYTAAVDLAVVSAAAFAALLRRLAAKLDGTPIDIMCHSLGSRLTIQGLTLALAAEPGLAKKLGRVVILGGAEYGAAARKLVATLGHLGAGVEVYNFASADDDVLGKLGQNFGPGEDGDQSVIGFRGLGLVPAPACWLDLDIGSKKLNKWFEDRADGVYLVANIANQLADHWGYFTVRGNMKFFARLLRDRSAWPITELRKASIPELGR